MNNNPYEILHLQEDATYDEIKKRYRHLTRSLHPDKQPLENYAITKRLFEQIDEAYKSISSPLRRHLFREYGLPALRILEDAPDYFTEFDVEVITAEQINRLRQLMTYLLYQRVASFQTHKTKFITKMVVNITKTLKGRPRNYKRHAKRNYILPEIENCSFQYEMVLPKFMGFANTFALQQTTANMKGDSKYTLGCGVSMARRVYWNYKLALQFDFSTEENNFALGINRICENNLSINFTPISLTNWNLTAPKISIEKSLHDYQISTTMDFSGGISLNYSESSHKRIGKSLKLFMERGSIGLIPRVEVQVSEIFRLFGQLSVGMQSQGKEDINLRPSLTYGYRLVVSQDLKLQLVSCMGSPNYLQVSFISRKFRVGIPLITAEVDMVKFQLMKVAAMVMTYMVLQVVRLKQRRDIKTKQKLLKDNESRLKDQKREITTRVGDAEISAQAKRQMEIKYNGLIILRAIFGEEKKIRRIAKMLKSVKLASGQVSLQRKLVDVEESILALDLPVGEIIDQAEDVTAIIQSEVVGAQLRSYSLESLRKYSPTIDPTLMPSIFILYVERGHLKTLSAECDKPIQLGTKRESEGSNLKRLVEQMVEQMVEYLL